MVDKRLDQLAEFSGCPRRWPGAGAPACRKRLRELGLFCPEKRWLQRLSKTYEEVSKKMQLGSAQDILAHTHVQSYKHYCWDFRLNRRRKGEDIPWPCLEFSTTEGIMQDTCLKYEYEYSVSKSIGDASKASLPASSMCVECCFPACPEVFVCAWWQIYLMSFRKTRKWHREVNTPLNYRHLFTQRSSDLTSPKLHWVHH